MPRPHARIARMPRPDRTPAVGRAIEALPASIGYLMDRQNALHA
jgi:hypothetical protein